jgi:iron complex outermembrane receptor protein
LRFASNGDGPTQWLAGVFYSDTARDYAQLLPTPGYDVATDAALGAGTAAATANGFPLDSPYNSVLPYDLEQTAIFGEVTHDFSDVLQLTVGGRWYDYDEVRTITQGGWFSSGFPGIVDQTSSDGFIPRFMISYDHSDNVTFNAQASQGFRLGGVNDPLNESLCTGDDIAIFGGFQNYGDETLWNYEAGVKMRTDNGVTINAAVFHTKIDDLQVTLDAGSCSSRISFNVPDAHTTGLEFEISAMPSDGLELSLAGSIVSAEFDTTVIDANGSVLGGVADGNRLASVPESQFAATITKFFPVEFAGGGEMYVAGSYQHVGDRITQPTDQVAGAGTFAHGLTYGGASGSESTTVDTILDSYDTLNLSAGLIKDTWELVLYVNNATDENANLSFNRERGGRARLAYMTNTPRTVGVTFRNRFD